MEHSSYYYTGLHVIAGIVTAAKTFRNVMVVNTYTIINACTTEVRGRSRMMTYQECRCTPGKAPHKPSGPSVSLYWLVANM